jgi:hypothetical protein
VEYYFILGGSMVLTVAATCALVFGCRAARRRCVRVAPELAALA